MKKVLFLMFLLFLIGLGAASVKAQVRIGGNAAPNASALLDLNATDATMNGTKGLALPRVNLTSNTMLLSGVTSNLTGMMVYNTTATLGAIGIYYWNGATWVRASLPSTSSSDSGRILISNGSTWVTAYPTQQLLWSSDTAYSTRPLRPASMYVVIDTLVHLKMIYGPNTTIRVVAAPVMVGDICFGSPGANVFNVIAGGGIVYVQNLTNGSFGYNVTNSSIVGVRCLRPSF